MVPSAPGLSSTTTGSPHLVESRSANMRAAASLALPGGNVTINFTGRSGQPARATFGKVMLVRNATITKKAEAWALRGQRCQASGHGLLRSAVPDVAKAVCFQSFIIVAPTLSEADRI